MKHTASEVQARAQRLQKARGREHMDRTGLDYRLMSIGLWAELYQKGPRMVANYRTRGHDMEPRSEFIRRINSMVYGKPIRSLPEAWRELEGIADEEGRRRGRTSCCLRHQALLVGCQNTDKEG